MIVNLLEATQLILSNANLNEDDIRYITFYNEETEEVQYCSYSEFSEIAEDIYYDENETLDTSRKIISSELSIIAERWWLRRSRDGEEGENWIYQEIPVPMEDLVQGVGELCEGFVISDIDVITEDYHDLVESNVREYPYAKADKIVINEFDYDIVNDDGIDKVMRDDKFAIIIASDGRYWTWSNIRQRDTRMLYHPELVKSVLEKTYVKNNMFDMDNIERELDLYTHGFNSDSFKELKIVWIPKGTSFNIATTHNPNSNTTKEIIEYPKFVSWMTA